MGEGYAMYVWTDSYDSTVPSCAEGDFLAWNKSDTKCFTHSWNTLSKRTWLWNTCKVPGREISYIYLSGVHWVTEQAYKMRDSNFPGVSLIRETLKDGHEKVPGLRIYALFADSDIEVSEKDKVSWIVYYNDYCANSAEERFDGYAVNNEAYGLIKCPSTGSSDDVRRGYLDKLMKIKTEAGKQTHGKLLTHYSVGWHWGRCNSVDYDLAWNGKTQPVTYHMIDIFDSSDIQVAWTGIEEIKKRLLIAGLQHARDSGKRIFTTLYLNKTSEWQTSFFPTKSHPDHGTEARLWSVVDKFSSFSIADAKPCLHYFRGVYSSGGNSDWPVHNG